MDKPGAISSLSLKKLKKTNSEISHIFSKNLALNFLYIFLKTLSTNLQSFTKYLRPNLIFLSNSALREKLNICFSGFTW